MKSKKIDLTKITNTTEIINDNTYQYCYKCDCYLTGCHCNKYKFATFKVKFFYEDKTIGNITLEEYRKGYLETHSFLKPSYRGKSIGLFMYVVAIQEGIKRGFKICSSDCTSCQAERVWKSQRLKKLFKIKRTRWWRWSANPLTSLKSNARFATKKKLASVLNLS